MAFLEGDVSSAETRGPDRTVVISADSARQMAVVDLWHGLKRHTLWWSMSVHETKQRFRRSLIGPFWMTLSMGIFIGALGFVMTRLFGQDPNWFVPYLATGIIFWTLMTSIVNEAGSVFVAAQGYIRNVPMPISVHYYRMIARNIIVWLHNMVIFVFILIFSFGELNWLFLLFVPGFLIFMLVVSIGGFCIAILSTRYRDIPQVVASVLQVVFFITPIFWSIDTFPDRPAFVTWNPFYHLLEVVRAPLLGSWASPLSWAVSLGLLAMAIPSAIFLYRRAYSRIPYWA